MVELRDKESYPKLSRLADAVHFSFKISLRAHRKCGFVADLIWGKSVADKSRNAYKCDIIELNEPPFPIHRPWKQGANTLSL